MDYSRIVTFIIKRDVLQLPLLKERVDYLFERLNYKLNISLYLLLYSLAVETPENSVTISEAEIVTVLNADPKVIHQALLFLKKEGHLT